MEQTLTILKPDTVKARNVGRVVTMIEAAGFRVLAAKMLRLSSREAEAFYGLHREKDFFDSLVAFMTEGPVIVMVLEAEDAVQKLRQLMGATDPEKAEAGTIRRKFGSNIERNAIHGSDAPETAAIETAYFFSKMEMF